MGASSSKHPDSSPKSKSSMLKDAGDLIVVSVSKKRGTFEYEPSLELFMEDEMRVVGVRWYLDPMKAQGYGFGHEFLVVDLQTPENRQLLIRAEKDYAGMGGEEYPLGGPAGGQTKVKVPVGGLIMVTRIEPAMFAKEYKDRDSKFDVDLQGSGKILMKDLIDILRACNPRYSLLKHNCWKYAYDTLRNLLKEFVGLADTSDDCKKKILEAYRTMPSPSLPAEILEDAAENFLGFSFLGAVFYCGAVGAIAAYEYLGGLETLQVSGTTVKGLAGSSLFISSMASANASLGERSWVRWFFIGYCSLVTLAIAVLVEDFAEMRKKHSVPRKRDEKS